MIRAFAITVVAGSLLVAGAAQAQSRQGDPEAGRRAIARFGCDNCHTLPQRPAHRADGCVGCHQGVRRRAAAMLGRRPEVTHLLTTPSLTHVTRRLEADYLVRYLQDPHDVRHRLTESMPRLPVSEADARNIVAFFSAEAGSFRAPASPAPSAARVDRGREVFSSGGCAGCHAFGNAPAPYVLPRAAIIAFGDAATLAPNLRYARERMDPDTMLAWIIDPRSVDPGAHMEAPEISAEDALAVRDYVLLGSPGRPVSPRRTPTVNDLTPLDRNVTFREVRALFGQSCIHCHSHATGARASQALGFEAFELDLTTWEGIRAGVTTASGEQHSILETSTGGNIGDAGAGSVSPLVARLLQRHAEAPRDLVTPPRDPLAAAERRRPPRGPVGMPLGLPPLSLEQIRIIHTWVVQGANSGDAN